MNKRVLLALAFVVLILTVAGVVAASSYKTRLTITSQGSSSSGEYTLQVKVIMNYGPFGGEQPLSDAVVQVTGQNGSFYRNFTLSNGVATFTLPEGIYTVNVASLHYTFKVDLTQNELATLTYAYLVS